jgi:hypothetical protein
MVTQGVSAREIERASWSQGVLTLISILIGTALGIAVGKAEQAQFLDLDYSIRLLMFTAYCATFFWFYHRFYVFVYRRASIFSILLPAIVGSALMATAYTVKEPERFALWSFVLFVGTSYALGITAVAVLRGKYRVIEGLPTERVLRSFLFTMLRSALLTSLMACYTGALIWNKLSPGPLTLDLALFGGNGVLFVLMSTLNWFYFTRPLEDMVDDNQRA